MRVPTFAPLSLALGLAVSVFALTPSARAEAEFDVAVTGGRIVVTAKGDWHINKEYPWRLTVGETKIDKSQFSLADKTASVAAPKGAVTLKGGVCSGEKCVQVNKALTVP